MRVCVCVCVGVVVSVGQCVSSSEYQCDSGQCVSVDDVCDGLAQCTDHSDEQHCLRTYICILYLCLSLSLSVNQSMKAHL